MYDQHDRLDNDKPKYFLIYDLETSRLDLIGQILSISFLLTDAALNPIEGYSKDLYGRLSILELPEPEAINANGIDLAISQKEGLVESELASQIHSFIQSCLNRCGSHQIKLVGHNASRFDLPFLRTLLIRNGFNPYFYGKILYLDSIHLLKHAAFEIDDILPFDKENERYSLSLNNLSKHLLKNTTPQSHKANEDVALLRDLLAYMKGKFVALWETKVFDTPVDNENPFYSLSIDMNNYQPSKLNFIKTPYVLLDSNKNMFLMIDLAKCKLANSINKESIFYRNISTGFLKIDYNANPDKDIMDLAIKAKESLSVWNCDNFFEKSTCDIEQDIYRLLFSDVNSLARILNVSENNLPPNLSDDMKEIWLRFRLKAYSFTNSPHQKVYDHHLKNYAQKRYIDGIKLNKFGDIDKKSSTFSDMKNRLAQMIDQAPKDKLAPLLSLKNYYETAYITKFLRD